MMTEAERMTFDSRIGFGEWWGLAAGPLAWAFDLGSSYAATPHACSTGHYYVLHVISLVALAVALSGFVGAFHIHSRLPKEADKQGHLPRDRAFFLSLAGIGMSLWFVVVIIAESVPRWILSPCA